MRESAPKAHQKYNGINKFYWCDSNRNGKTQQKEEEEQVKISVEMMRMKWENGYVWVSALVSERARDF